MISAEEARETANQFCPDISEEEMLTLIDEQVGKAASAGEWKVSVDVGSAPMCEAESAIKTLTDAGYHVEHYYGYYWEKSNNPNHTFVLSWEDGK